MIELQHIVKRYGHLEVIKDVSLEIPQGKIVSIVGPSGAGKTTLLQIMGTLDRPDSGTVTYDGRNVMEMNDKQLSRFRNTNIGFVFQFHQLLPEFSLVENVAMPALIKGEKPKEAYAKAAKLIARLGLEDRYDHRPGQLSGGECQRAAVARALVNSPEIVLADEPSGSLDTQNRNELHQLFFDLCDETGTTFVIVTHDESLAANSHSVVHMRDGKIVNITN